jgi:uncharacterized protein (TIGR03382 family)
MIASDMIAAAGFAVLSVGLLRFRRRTRVTS